MQVTEESISPSTEFWEHSTDLWGTFDKIREKKIDNIVLNKRKAILTV